MRRFLLLVTILVCSFSLSAQELTVQSFKLKETELAAKVNPVYDLNNEACALIKVAIVGRDISFEGTIVKKEEHTTGEYYVYMPAGSKRLKVFSPSFLPLTIEFQDYDIKLEKNLTYELRILTPQQQELIPEIDRQYLVMTISPASASVYIDGVMQNIDSEGIAAVELLCGEHTYKVEKLGYKTQEGKVFVSADEKKELTISLTDNTGVIKVNSSPVSEANVYIDDELCGETPFTSERLKSGQYEVKVTKAGYYVFSKTVDLKAGDSVVVDAILEASFSTVVLTAPVPDADIFLDGKFLAKGSWEGPVDPGKHLVEVKKDGYADASEVIEVRKGAREEIQLPELFAHYGVLNVSSSPLNAAVSVDGAKIGSTPLRTNQITVGRHSVLIQKDGYEPQTFEIVMAKDSTVNCAIQLQQIKSKEAVAASIKVEEKKDEPVQASSVSEKKEKVSEQNGHFFIGAVAGIPDVSLGAMVGYTGNTGGFVKFKSNFKTFDAAYECTSDGKTKGGYVVTTGEQAVSVMNVTGGIVFRLAKPLYMYAGAGYGSYGLGWKDINGEWASVSDYTFKGVAITAGAILKMGPVGLTVGSNVTSFKAADLEAGITIWL